MDKTSKAPRCPVCTKNAPDPRYRPFCSKRCADVDLGRWFSGRYVVSGAQTDDESDRTPDEETS